MPIGRPSDYNERTAEAICKRIVEVGEDGGSVVEMAYELGVVKQTLLNWSEQHPEFLAAFTQAKHASQVWWERKGRTGMEKTPQEFQSSIWSRSMAARFPDDWREKTGVDHTSDGKAITGLTVGFVGVGEQTPESE